MKCVYYIPLYSVCVYICIYIHVCVTYLEIPHACYQNAFQANISTRRRRLYPLRRESVMQREVLRIAPWGPPKLQLGKARKCHLYMGDESQSISNVHAELSLMYSVGKERDLRLFVCDLSKNGTWVPGSEELLR